MFSYGPAIPFHICMCVCIYIYNIYIWGIYIRGIYTNVPSSVIHHCQILEASHMSDNWWMDTQVWYHTVNQRLSETSLNQFRKFILPRLRTCLWHSLRRSRWHMLKVVRTQLSFIHFRETWDINQYMYDVHWFGPEKWDNSKQGGSF